MNLTKYLQYQDALKFLKKQLDETIAEAKSVNSSYQAYLQKNPYKVKRKEFEAKKKQLTKKIFALIDMGHDKWDGKTQNL